MELKEVPSSETNRVILQVLKTLFSETELPEVVEGIDIQLEEGSKLYSIVEDEVLGFTLMSPLDEEGGTEGKIEIISVDEIFLSSSFQIENMGDFIGTEFKKVAKKFGNPKIEIPATRRRAKQIPHPAFGAFVLAKRAQHMPDPHKSNRQTQTDTEAHVKIEIIGKHGIDGFHTRMPAGQDPVFI